MQAAAPDVMSASGFAVPMLLRICRLLRVTVMPVHHCGDSFQVTVRSLNYSSQARAGQREHQPQKHDLPEALHGQSMVCAMQTGNHSVSPLTERGLTGVRQPAYSPGSPLAPAQRATRWASRWIGS